MSSSPLHYDNHSISQSRKENERDHSDILMELLLSFVKEHDSSWFSHSFYTRLMSSLISASVVPFHDFDLIVSSSISLYRKSISLLIYQRSGNNLGLLFLNVLSFSTTCIDCNH